MAFYTHFGLFESRSKLCLCLRLVSGCTKQPSPHVHSFLLFFNTIELLKKLDHLPCWFLKGDLLSRGEGGQVGKTWSDIAPSDLSLPSFPTTGPQPQIRWTQQPCDKCGLLVGWQYGPDHRGQGHQHTAVEGGLIWGPQGHGARVELDGRAGILFSGDVYCRIE